VRDQGRGRAEAEHSIVHAYTPFLRSSIYIYIYIYIYKEPGRNGVSCFFHLVL
jgi:hypothetical protein